MNNVFLFFRQKGSPDAQLERDFRRAYQEPSLGYLQLAFVLGIVGFTGFYVMDTLHGTVMAVAGVPHFRLAVCALYVAGILLTHFHRPFVARHYTLFVNGFMSLGMLGAALLPIAVHGNSSATDIYWSLNSSLTTGAIVIYGTSRLTSRNTALIVVTGCLIGVLTVIGLPSFDWYRFSRLVFHLTFVNLAAFSLRETLEQRERSLFLVGRDNLSKNIYAKELEVARADAEEGNEVKLRFLANMSHEFRTPMHGVLQTLELAARSAGAELSARIEQARVSGQALLRTLDSILEYTRWTQRRLSSHPTRVSIAEKLREAVKRHEPSATERGLTVSLRLDLVSAEDTVLVDELMLVEVIGRVLDNAVRFTTSGRVDVEVELARSEGAPYPHAVLVVTIADTGVGIPQDREQAIFTPFYQVDDGSNRTVGGTGLGLAIVKRLTEAMQGSIGVTSVVGVGSTFRIRLPVEICDDIARPSPARATRTPRTVGTDHPATLQGSVLLVDDNTFNAELTAELLRLMGLQVTLASDGAQAHREAHSRRFDVVLMDCQMPNVDGYEATRRIRQTERASSASPVPIIAVTANALAGDRERCLAAGMNDYLSKPYTAAQLRAKLEIWLTSPSDGDQRPSEAARASSTPMPDD